MRAEVDRVGSSFADLRAIDEVVKAGRQAIVLVPEIALTPQTIDRFRKRFDDVAVAIIERKIGVRIPGELVKRLELANEAQRLVECPGYAIHDAVFFDDADLANGLIMNELTAAGDSGV